MARLLFAVLLVILPRAAFATNLNWNLAGSGNASTAANWSPAQVPVAGDSLLFNLSGTRGITFSAGVGASTCQTWRAGLTTVQFSSPHFTSGALRIALLNGDHGEVFQTLGSYAIGGPCTIGDAAGTNGQLKVLGSNVLFQVQNPGFDMFVGHEGSGTLVVGSGGVLRVSDDFVVGNRAGAIGTATVTGSSALNASTLETEESNGDIFVGIAGTGTLNATLGGVVTAADDLFLGNNNAASGTVNISDTGSLVTVRDQCGIANNLAAGTAAGTGTINVNAGGTLKVQTLLSVGDPDGGTGTLHLNGGVVHTRGLALDPVHGVLDFDGGTLRIDGGTSTLATPGSVSMSSSTGAANFEVIRGANVTVPNDVFLATGGTGSLLVKAGSTLSLGGTLFITSGTVAVTLDSSSAIVTTGGFDLGGSSSNTTLTVDHGSTFHMGVFESADEASGTSTITVANNSKFLVDTQCFLAGDAGHAGGTADMTISSSGSLSGNGVGTSYTIYPGAMLHLNAGGTAGGSSATMDVQGVLDMAGGSSSVGTHTLSGNGRIRGFGTVTGRVVSTVTTSRVSAVGGNLTVGLASSSTGFDSRGTVEAGSSILTLVDLNGITLGDTTTVAGGTLKALVPLTNAVARFVGASGTIDAPSLINAGTFALGGATPGTLALTGTFNNQGTGTTRVRVNGTAFGKADKVAITGAATLAGALELVFDPNGAYVSGVPVTILTFASRTGTFPSLIVDNMNPAAFTVLYTATSIQVVFHQSVAVEPVLPLALSFAGRTGLFELALPRAAQVHVAMFDVRGREVARLVDGALAAGIHRYPVPAGTARGVYFGRAVVGDLVRTARVVVR